MKGKRVQFRDPPKGNRNPRAPIRTQHSTCGFASKREEIKKKKRVMITHCVRRLVEQSFVRGEEKDNKVRHQQRDLCSENGGSGPFYIRGNEGE